MRSMFSLKIWIALLSIVFSQAVFAGTDYLLEAEKTIKRGDTTRTVMYYHLALRQNPADIDTELRLAKLYLARGENEKANKHLAKILSNSPNNIPAMLTQAQVYSKVGERQQECNIYKNILTISSQTPEAHLGVGKCMQEQGDETAATEAFNHYKDLSGTK